MKILLILNFNGSIPCLIVEQIAARDGECVVVNPHEGGTLASDARDFDGLLMLGGWMSAANPDYAEAFDGVTALLRDFHARSKPILGICLGCQLIAKAFGKDVFPNEEPQLGFKRLEVTEAGRNDPLLKGLSPQQYMFVWAEDKFDLPEEAVLLMSERQFANQIFRVGETTYAIQGHPEATEDLLQRWFRYKEGVIERFGERGQAMFDSIDEGMAEYFPRSYRFGRTLGDRWLDLVEQRAVR
jgi:GMP synthase (glutamine-hydrolysing)